MEGADEVVEEIRVGEIHITPGSETEKEMEDLLRIAAKKKVPILPMKDGVSLEGWTNCIYLCRAAR